jgi:regulator of nonsense transcripts 2
MTATLDRIWSDISSSLVTDLEQQFHGQARFKKNQNLEGRMRTARYIGELTKFRVAPPIIFLRCLRRCLDDFTGSNVDVACCLLETCGRYLYRLKHTHSRLDALMETMTRLSKAKVSIDIAVVRVVLVNILSFTTRITQHNPYHAIRIWTSDYNR